MGAMNLAEYRIDIRTEISGTITSFPDANVDRAVEKTEALLARLIPKKNIAEATITIDRTAEVLAISTNTGTTTYKPVKWDSETITNAAGTAMVRDTNYTINYMTGVITEIGSLLPDAADYAITYKQDTQRLDIGTLITDPIKITRVEYPVGDQPPTYLGSWDWIENFIILHKDTILTEDKHIRIYYDSKWVGATASTDGDYPAHLDDAIVIGASGQCLIFKAEEHVQSAVTELLLVNAAADSMATPLAAIASRLNIVTDYIDTAFIQIGKMDTYLVDTVGSGTDCAKDVLANITDDIAQLRTRIDAILSKSNDFLFSADTDPSAKYYLTQGDAYILTVNVADRVAEKYADYARTSIQLFGGLVSEASIRMENIRTYIEEAQGWVTIANGFRDDAVQRISMANTIVAQASQYIAEVNAWAIQADKYTTTSREYMDIAGRYLASGQAKINEFYVMLGFKPELAHSQASAGQATLY